ncbi:hypothetical protein BVC80_577g19 [Macleaya cordata]|uniref:Uncharacterized protein n=1 Tax=Macleaya cordata TaxID=56857 RepID=A0A200QTE7_MACCD|nr:hypothetical protein BVC80_577g19 [Macleaya cordata]
MMIRLKQRRSAVLAPPRKETEVSSRDACLLCVAVGSVRSASDGTQDLLFKGQGWCRFMLVDEIPIRPPLLI